MQAKEAAIRKLNFSEDILSLSHFHSVLQTKPIPEYVLVSLGQHVNSEVRLAALSNTLHPNWMKSLIEVPKKNPLFLRWVSDAESTVKSAVESDNVFFFVGKDANEAALATSALARVFAISDGASVEPTRLDESQEHSDWLVRMSIASNICTPTNLLNRLKQDSHALVAKQAEITIAKLSDKPEMEMLDKEKRQSCFYELSKVVAAAIKSKHQMVAPDDTVWGYCMHPEVLWDPSRINEVTKTWSKDEWHLFGAWILPLEPEALAPYLTSESIVAFAVKYLKRKKLSLAYLASHPFCSEVSLKLLAEDKNNNVCCAVAKNPNTLSASLKLLAELKGGGRVLINNIAGNPNTPDVILDKLAKDKDEDVRKAVAANPNTSMASLKLLAREEDKWIRFAVACNLNTSIALLTLLAEDEMSLTRKAVAENPNTPVHLLTQLAQDKDEWVRRNVAENPNTPVMLLKLLAKDEDYLVLRGVARNPNTPKASLALLARDKNEYIRKAVADNGKVPAVKLETTSSNKYAFLQSLSLAEYKEYIRFALSPDIILPADITTLDIRRGVESLGLLREEISYEELTEMRISKDRLQRVAVCFHNNVTENFLAILSQDKDLAVAEIAKEMYADLFENIPILKK
jgi:3-methyladenine DNA glycosylase AlkC